jgi:hypothetical protein
MMRRREFITFLGGAVAWPLAARAQQGDRVRRIGVLMSGDQNDPTQKTYISAFIQALAGFGWTDGRNLRMGVRWYGDDSNRMRALAQELVGLKPDIILTGTTPATVALQRETRTIPIVFVAVVDPVVTGIVPRLDRPGGNVTGAIIVNPDNSFPSARTAQATPRPSGRSRSSLMAKRCVATKIIYIDPPFDTGVDFSFTATVPEDRDGEERAPFSITNGPSIIEQKAYRDKWGHGLDSYLQWFY